MQEHRHPHDKEHGHHHAHAPQAIAQPIAPTGAIYTCPMHPEIRQDQPGNCPICGMTLEPVIPQLGDDDNP